ncbi:hypothetical protein BON30_03090 [Cystobacter ferrugineus]|uniref:PNPLA domain-containing protein n=2 Tax=Cystobacter ferrugineus TaxID=83449 RepID=A0A1L9BIY4_9BACT|nr:hypothetical protein BON30_03090 [Cystobacter ferrugineus]
MSFRLRGRTMEHFKILSLDGGGTWALIEVRALIELFGPETRGHEVLRRFQLVVANSGGSIVAAGLAADFTLGQLLQLFRDETKRRGIFVERPWYQRMLAAIPPLQDLEARYATRKKLEGLERAFSESKLEGFARLTMEEWKARAGQGLADIVITAFDYDRRRAIFFRTRPQSPSASRSPSRNPTFAQAVHASSNAPITFFDEPAAFLDRRFWDGAMGGYNNPTMAGVVEALSHAGDGTARVEPSSLRVLSLGTGMVLSLPPDATGEVEDKRLLHVPEEPGLVSDIRKAALCIVDDPPDAASFVAHVTLGHRLPRDASDVVQDGPVIRLSPVLRPVKRNGRWMYPEKVDPGFYQRVSELGMDAVKKEHVLLIDSFCDAWIQGRIPNQSLRANQDLEPEVGHARFSDALTQLRTWLDGDLHPPSVAAAR